MAEIDVSLENVTRNLRKRIEALEKVKRELPSKIFADVYDEEYTTLSDMVKDRMINAIKDTERFNDPIFEKQALSSFPAFPIVAKLEGQGTDNVLLSITVDLSSMGGVEDYVAAVKAARKIFDRDSRKRAKNRKKGSKKYVYNPKVASNFWKNKVWAGKDAAINPEDHPDYEGFGGENLYTKTMGMYLKHYGNLAPYVQLVDQGISTLSSDRGGYPTPAKTDPTKFITLAEAEIRDLWKTQMEKKSQMILGDIEKELGDAQELENELYLAIETGQSRTWTEPQIIQSIVLEGRKRYVYVTSNMAIGISERPRTSSGKYISVKGF